MQESLSHAPAASAPSATLVMSPAQQPEAKSSLGAGSGFGAASGSFPASLGFPPSLLGGSRPGATVGLQKSAHVQAEPQRFAPVQQESGSGVPMSQQQVRGD